VSGFKSESLSGFKLERMSDFVGIRNKTTSGLLSPKSSGSRPSFATLTADFTLPCAASTAPGDMLEREDGDTGDEGGRWEQAGM